MDPPHRWVDSGGSQHRLFCGVLMLIAGFAVMHVVFVGGQSGPLLPLSLSTSLRSEDPPLPEASEASYTQLQERARLRAPASVPSQLTRCRRHDPRQI
jgi:hypothetical protein